MAEPLSPEFRKLRARQAAHTMHATHDSRETTAPGRKAFLDSFLDQVDPDRVLSEAERNRRADQAKRAHFTKMAMRSVKARADRAGGAA